jgi:hypothetical protein
MAGSQSGAPAAQAEEPVAAEGEEPAVAVQQQHAA